MKAGYVIVRLYHGIAPHGILCTGVHQRQGTVYDNRDAAERNCEWANSPVGREQLGLLPMDKAEVMELHSIIEDTQ